MTAEIAMAPEIIGRRIQLIRGLKVMLASDIAELYGVPTKALNQAVKRNLDRFPEDFMFQLSRDELQIWKSQTVTSNPKSGIKMGLRIAPYAFTEHGVTMLASVLTSGRAVQMSIRIVRAFIHLREILSTHADLAARVGEIEQEQQRHASVINILAEEIDELRAPPPEPAKRQIGFNATATA